MTATIALILAGLASILSGTSILLHVIAPRTKTQLDDKAAAAVDRAIELLKKLGGSGVAVLAVVALASCGASARQQTIATTLAVVTSASNALVVYDEHHQAELVAAAASKEQGAADLAVYRAHRAPVVAALRDAFVALEAAAQVDGDASITSMLAAATRAAAELAAFQGSK